MEESPKNTWSCLLDSLNNRSQHDSNVAAIKKLCSECGFGDELYDTHSALEAMPTLDCLRATTGSIGVDTRKVFANTTTLTREDLQINISEDDDDDVVTKEVRKRQAVANLKRHLHGDAATLDMAAEIKTGVEITDCEGGYAATTETHTTAPQPQHAVPAMRSGLTVFASHVALRLSSLYREARAFIKREKHTAVLTAISECETSILTSLQTLSDAVPDVSYDVPPAADSDLRLAYLEQCLVEMKRTHDAHTDRLETEALLLKKALSKDRERKAALLREVCRLKHKLSMPLSQEALDEMAYLNASDDDYITKTKVNDILEGVMKRFNAKWCEQVATTREEILRANAALRAQSHEEEVVRIARYRQATLDERRRCCHIIATVCTRYDTHIADLKRDLQAELLSLAYQQLSDLRGFLAGTVDAQTLLTPLFSLCGGDTHITNIHKTEKPTKKEEGVQEVRAGAGGSGSSGGGGGGGGGIGGAWNPTLSSLQEAVKVIRTSLLLLSANALAVPAAVKLLRGFMAGRGGHTHLPHAKNTPTPAPILTEDEAKLNLDDIHVDDAMSDVSAVASAAPTIVPLKKMLPVEPGVCVRPDTVASHVPVVSFGECDTQGQARSSGKAYNLLRRKRKNDYRTFPAKERKVVTSRMHRYSHDVARCKGRVVASDAKGILFSESGDMAGSPVCYGAAKFVPSLV